MYTYTKRRIRTKCKWIPYTLTLIVLGVCLWDAFFFHQSQSNFDRKLKEDVDQFDIIETDNSGIPYFLRPSTELEELNNNNTQQDDNRLVKIIASEWMQPPASKSYSLTDPYLIDFSMGQSSIVDKILKQKEEGFFVEVGALDGETRSNTLYFEKVRKWQGLLIEADPKNYYELSQKNRKTHSIPACVNTVRYPSVMTFNRAKNRGRLINDDSALLWIQNTGLALQLVRTQCFPLYSMLLALGRTKIDYLSLDVEGVELEVLQTIPFDKVDITVMTVEFVHGAQGRDVLQDFVESKGYMKVNEVVHAGGLANDFVFVKKDYVIDGIMTK